MECVNDRLTGADHPNQFAGLEIFSHEVLHGRAFRHDLCTFRTSWNNEQVVLVLKGASSLALIVPDTISRAYRRRGLGRKISVRENVDSTGSLCKWWVLLKRCSTLDALLIGDEGRSAFDARANEGVIGDGAGIYVNLYSSLVSESRYPEHTTPSPPSHLQSKSKLRAWRARSFELSMVEFKPRSMTSGRI